MNILRSFRAITDLTPISNTNFWSIARLNCANIDGTELDDTRVDTLDALRLPLCLRIALHC